MPQKEKRKFPRINVNFPIRYKAKRGNFSVKAKSYDLSIGGIRLVSDRLFPLGTNVHLELNILSRIISPIIGAVVWSDLLPYSGKYQMGVEFLQVKLEDKGQIADYINLHALL